MYTHVFIHEIHMPHQTYRFTIRFENPSCIIRNIITMSQLGGREVLIRLGNVILSMSVADAAATLQDRIIGWVGGIALLI